jgi:ABC-type histidine transport system ATPase subunit
VIFLDLGVVAVDGGAKDVLDAPTSPRFREFLSQVL